MRQRLATETARQPDWRNVFGLLWLVFIVLYFLGLILAAVKAYQGTMFKLPIIGNMAAKWAGV